ncbi:hypothetical protein AOQ84DRAFT_353935 [Glonium stellatum]|uniref:Rhodopsin domain-containing protein n=1 Tax=Glonium stellatum TaxID=574774 RepID=A0A8E2F301_9PEZI|nr:hypothetical protein AOQ84DRAFT_353935 [Glonium stellatum]
MAFENLQLTAYAVATVMFILGTASIFLRLYCRGFVLNKFGWDDVMAVFLLVVNTLQQAILYSFLHYGCGKHITLLSAYQVQKIIEWLFVEEIFYMFTHWVIKQAFLLFYLRLSPKKTLKRLVWATMGLNTAFTLTNWLLAFLQCRPFAAILQAKDYPDAKCIDELIILIVPSILNIVTDIIILILPISTVWSLQMSRRRKIGVVAVISFGASAVLISSLRLIILYQLYVSPDPSYVLGKMVIVAALEIGFAILAVNLPSVKALWNKVTGDASEGSRDCAHGDRLFSTEQRTGQRSRPTSKLPITEGNISTIEHRSRSRESEEELFQQTGKIKVMTDIAVTTTSRVELEDNTQGYSPV